LRQLILLARATAGFLLRRSAVSAAIRSTLTAAAACWMRRRHPRAGGFPTAWGEAAAKRLT